MTKRSRSTKKKQNRPDSHPAPPAPSKPPRRLPLWQALLLPLASILIFFLLLEGGLALVGIKPALQTEDPFVGFAGNVPLFVPESGSGGELLVTAPNKLTFFNDQSFPLEKAQGAYRIFCLGGSTTYGRPYNDATSFAGWLRELLPAADGHKHWEVINAGGISYASYRVAHLMEELVRYQPVLFVIYTGHNEFLEKRTYGKLQDVPDAVRSTVALLARTRTWAAMTSAVKGLGIYPQAGGGDRDQLSAEVNTILSRSAGPERYTRDDLLRENILEHYRISLERMVELARSAGAKVIFVTPASNLKDCSPFKSEHTAGLDAATRKRSEQLLAKAKEAIQQEDWDEALDILDAALALDPRHAELLYRRGRVLLAQGRFGEAETALRQARDEDVCPLRALSPMRRIVAEVAREQGVALVDFVDLLQQRMQSAQGYPIPGQEYFLDHVHPTIEGNKILAVALIQAMIRQQLVHPGPDWGEQAIAAVAAEIEGRIDQRVHGQALANLGRVLSWAGKTEDAERLARQALATAGDDPKVAADAASILAAVYQSQGRPKQVLQSLFTALKGDPDNPELRFKLGLTQLNRPFRKLEKAAANILLACQQMPRNDLAYLTFGLTMAERGRLRIAYASLLKALRLNPKNTDAEGALAQLRRELGERNPNPQLPRVSLENYPSGAPRKLVQVRRDANGRRIPDGIEAEWYKNGRLKRFRDLVQGEPNGLELTWDRDGRLLSRVAHRQAAPVDSGSGL